MPVPLYPVIVQERVIKASLNSSMLQSMLTGVHTIVYGATMYLYISRNKSNTRVVVSMITVLYLLSLINFIIQWYWLDQSMVVNGSTRMTIFLATAIDEVSPFLDVFASVVFYAAFAVSDALLIWRCYHVWGMSLRVIAVPSALFIGECALFVASVVLSALANSLVFSNPNIINQSDNVISAYVIISLATTVITTFLIGYRIHTTVTWINGSRSKHRFNHIMTMIVESAAMYSVALIALSLPTVVPSFTYVGTLGDIAEYYIDSVAGFVSGMAPTILVARIALKGTDTGHISTQTPPRISDLEFGSIHVTREKDNEQLDIQVSIQAPDADCWPGNNQTGILTTGSGMIGGENVDKDRLND